jgi:hypothetical protein
LHEYLLRNLIVNLSLFQIGKVSWVELQAFLEDCLVELILLIISEERSNLSDSLIFAQLLVFGIHDMEVKYLHDIWFDRLLKLDVVIMFICVHHRHMLIKWLEYKEVKASILVVALDVPHLLISELLQLHLVVESLLAVNHCIFKVVTNEYHLSEVMGDHDFVLLWNVSIKI